MVKGLFNLARLNDDRHDMEFMDDMSRFIYDCRMQYTMTGDEGYLKRMVRESVPLL